MSHLIKIYSVCKFSYFRPLVFKELSSNDYINNVPGEETITEINEANNNDGPWPMI